jgi:hypothetical protein
MGWNSLPYTQHQTEPNMAGRTEADTKGSLVPMIYDLFLEITSADIGSLPI